MIYRGISLLSVFGKMYGWVLVERLRRAPQGGEGGYRSGLSMCGSDLLLKQLDENTQEKKSV